jgi:hypothetical protein
MSDHKSHTSSTPARTGSLPRRAAAFEAAMWRSLYAWLRRRPVPLAPGDAPFSYLGATKLMLGFFIGLSAIELPIADLIVRNVVPWEPARWIVLALGVWGLLWMIGLFASMKLHPHVVGERGIRVRLGSGIDFTVPWDDVEAVGKRYRSLPSGKSVQVEEVGERRILHVVVGNQTSVDVRLSRPISFAVAKGPAGPVDEVRLHADDPDGFVRAARAAATRDRATSL